MWIDSVIDLVIAFLMPTIFFTTSLGSSPVNGADGGIPCKPPAGIPAEALSDCTPEVETGVGAYTFSTEGILAPRAR